MKNLNIFKSTIFSLVVSTAMVSCGKYEEGPKLSLASKKSRLENKWHIESQTKNGVAQSVDADDRDDILEFTKDGQVRVFDPTDNPSNVTSGTWVWANDKEAITTVFTSSAAGFSFSYTQTSTIKRLTKDELWYEYTDTNGNIYFEKYSGND